MRHAWRASAFVSALALGGVIPAPSGLAVLDGDAWREWWRSDRAPVHWDAGDTVLARHATWHAASRGVEWTEIALAGSGEAWRTRVVVVRFDPARVRLRLDTAFSHRGSAAWTTARAPANALFAVNAGQFLQSMPWGWVLLDGHQYLAPGNGPLSTAVVIDSGGAVHWLHGAAVRSSVPGAQWAFQSYPTLLRDGDVPPELRVESGLTTGVDLSHRDARAAIGQLRDGRVVIALTRFDALGSALGFVPFGLTSPEMAAVMGALGARDAVMLDGGISGQLAVHDLASGSLRRWPGVRAVPLGLVGYATTAIRRSATRTATGDRLSLRPSARLFANRSR